MKDEEDDYFGICSTCGETLCYCGCCHNPNCEDVEFTESVSCEIEPE